MGLHGRPPSCRASELWAPSLHWVLAVRDKPFCFYLSSLLTPVPPRSQHCAWRT